MVKRTMNQGIVTVAFSPDYDQLGAACATITRKHTNLPIHVITNVPTDKLAAWPTNCTFQYCNAARDQNRHWKTIVWHHTPFDVTLYMDCDVVVLNPGVEQLFQLEEDMVLNPYLAWKVGDKILRLYKNTMVKFGIQLPITV